MASNTATAKATVRRRRPTKSVFGGNGLSYMQID